MTRPGAHERFLIDMAETDAFTSLCADRFADAVQDLLISSTPNQRWLSANSIAIHRAHAEMLAEREQSENRA